MTSRKAAFKDDETPHKRQRIIANDHDARRALVSFESLNNDCVLQIFSFLPVDDINSFGTVNHRNCQIRRHESLDQTRTATIICSRRKQTTPQSLRDVLNTVGVTLSTQYKHLKILGLEALEYDPSYDAASSERLILPNIAKLELAMNPDEHSENKHISSQPLGILGGYLPNMKELVLNGVEIETGHSIWNFFRRLAKLTKVTLVGGVTTAMAGHDFSKSSTIRDLALDECCLVSAIMGAPPMRLRWMILNLYSMMHHLGGDDDYLMKSCRLLQSLSMKGATWTIVNHTGRVFEPEPIPQEMLIKMVRRHPSLRWLRSDLSQENIAMLQQERPEITFVSD